MSNTSNNNNSPNSNNNNGNIPTNTRPSFRDKSTFRPTTNPLITEDSDDLTVRKQIRDKDLDIVKQTYEDLEREEKELKEFFGELKQPITEDPTLVRKKRYEEKMSAYKEVVQNLDFKNLLRRFWTYQPPTPEEIETMADCRKYTIKNIALYATLGFTITSLTSFVGILSGSMFGIIKSTEYTLRRFENLGPDYDLGRLAISEIEEYRMDRMRKRAN